jgi:hypothetical protein
MLPSLSEVEQNRLESDEAKIEAYQSVSMEISWIEVVADLVDLLSETYLCRIRNRAARRLASACRNSLDAQVHAQHGRAIAMLAQYLQHGRPGSPCEVPGTECELVEASWNFFHS